MPLIDLTTRDGWENLPSMAERTMLRLLLVIDRRGRYDGRLPQLATALWPLGDGPTQQALGDLISVLEHRRLLTIYRVDDRPYILVHGTQGAGHSKWPDPPGQGQVQYVPRPDDPEVIRFPCTRKQEFVICRSHVDEWQKAYPALQIDQQLRRMLLWLKENPSNLKTRNGIGKFVHHWLGKEQNQAGRVTFRPHTANKSLAITTLYGNR